MFTSLTPTSNHRLDLDTRHSLNIFWAITLLVLPFLLLLLLLVFTPPLDGVLDFCTQFELNGTDLS